GGHSGRGHGGGGHGGGHGVGIGGHGGGRHGAIVGHGCGRGAGRHGVGHIAGHPVRAGHFTARGDLGRRVFGNRGITNVALRSQLGAARFRGGFFGSAWPWWRGGLVLGWFGPLFWPYAHYDLFD